ICTCPLENSGISCSPPTNHIVGTLDLALCTATEKAKRSDPYTRTWGFFAFCPKQGCTIMNSKRKILLIVNFIFENTEFSSSFPIDGKEAKDLGLQGSAIFTGLFLNRMKL